MLTARERLYTRQLGGRSLDPTFRPIRKLAEEKINTFTLPELRVAISHSIAATTRAIEQAADTERQVQRIEAQMQLAITSADSQAAEMALLAAKAAQAHALVQASATQLDISEVMAQATREHNALGAVRKMRLTINANLKEIELADRITPLTPKAEAEQRVRHAVARAAVARAQTAVVQAEVALAQARVLKLDLALIRETVKSAYARLQATEQAADFVTMLSGTKAQTHVAAAQASAAAAVAWSQLAISDVQVAMARASRRRASLEYFIIEAETQLREARAWAANAEISADRARDATADDTPDAETALRAQRAVVKAQSQAQVSVAKAQTAMIEVQVAIARAQRAHETANAAQHATTLAQLAAKEVQLTFMLATTVPNALTTVSAIVTVATAVMPTRPRLWYEEEGVRRDISQVGSEQALIPDVVNQPFVPDRFDPLTIDRPLFDDPAPPSEACGPSCAN